MRGIVKTKYIILLPLVLFLLGGIGVNLAAQQAVVRNLAGTVEIKRAGSETWENAQAGQTLGGETVISTGFRSTAVISFGNSVLTVKPLTRLSITELARLQDAEKVELNLQTGRVRAEITPSEAGRNEFVVRSTNATSSVRGTVFEFDTVNLLVLEGTVEFEGSSGPPFLIDAIGSTFVDERNGRVLASRKPGGSSVLPTHSDILSGPEPDSTVENSDTELITSVSL